MYGEPIGCASVMFQSPTNCKCVQVQLNDVVHPMYANQPRHDIGIDKIVLENKDNFASWEQY